MGQSPREDKCILHHFGKNGSDKQSSFRVCMYVHFILGHYLELLCRYEYVSACIMHVSACIGSYFVGI